MSAELMKQWSGQFTMIQVKANHFGMNSIQLIRLKSANISVCTTMGVTSLVRSIVFVHLPYQFFKNWEDMSRFCEALIPLFWTSGDVSCGFQSQSGQPYSDLVEVCVLHVPRFTSGAIPADLLAASMAAVPFSFTYPRALILISSCFIWAIHKSSKLII